MASLSQFFLFSILFSTILLTSNAQTKPFKLPIEKDKATLQYYSSIEIGTPKTSANLVLDLGGQYLWYACDNGFNSSSYRPINCNTKMCQEISKGSACLFCDGRTFPGCSNKTCAMFPLVNPYNMNETIVGGLSEDFIALASTSGVSSSKRLSFSCVDKRYLIGLAPPARNQGMLGLGRSQNSLPTQLALANNLPTKFALCLPSLTGKGSVIIGGGPYIMPPLNEDLFHSVQLTPLFRNLVASQSEVRLDGDPLDEYFIGVTSIKIDTRVVHFDASFLDINATTRVGGTKISTTTPYTILHSSIYTPFVNDFVKRALARNIARVASVAPFGACFSTKNVRWTRGGPRVPMVEPVLPGNTRDVLWTINGANSIVMINKNVMCLGFVDGGLEPRSSIVIGGLQLEDNLLEFDLTTSRLGFSSSLLPKGTRCA